MEVRVHGGRRKTEQARRCFEASTHSFLPSSPKKLMAPSTSNDSRSSLDPPQLKSVSFASTSDEPEGLSLPFNRHPDSTPGPSILRNHASPHAPEPENGAAGSHDSRETEILWSRLVTHFKYILGDPICVTVFTLWDPKDSSNTSRKPRRRGSLSALSMMQKPEQPSHPGRRRWTSSSLPSITEGEATDHTPALLVPNPSSLGQMLSSPPRRNSVFFPSESATVYVTPSMTLGGPEHLLRTQFHSLAVRSQRMTMHFSTVTLDGVLYLRPRTGAPESERQIAIPLNTVRSIVVGQATEEFRDLAPSDEERCFSIVSGTLGTVAVRLDDKKQSRWISEANEGRRDAHRDLWVFGLCSILKQNLLNVILRKKIEFRSILHPYFLSAEEQLVRFQLRTEKLPRFVIGEAPQSQQSSRRTRRMSIRRLRRHSLQIGGPRVSPPTSSPSSQGSDDQVRLKPVVRVWLCGPDDEAEYVRRLDAAGDLAPVFGVPNPPIPREPVSYSAYTPPRVPKLTLVYRYLAEASSSCGEGDFTVECRLPTGDTEQHIAASVHMVHPQDYDGSEEKDNSATSSRASERSLPPTSHPPPGSNPSLLPACPRAVPAQEDIDAGAHASESSHTSPSATVGGDAEGQAGSDEREAGGVEIEAEADDDAPQEEDLPPRRRRGTLASLVQTILGVRRLTRRRAATQSVTQAELELQRRSNARQLLVGFVTGLIPSHMKAWPGAPFTLRLRNPEAFRHQALLDCFGSTLITRSVPSPDEREELQDTVATVDCDVRE